MSYEDMILCVIFWLFLKLFHDADSIGKYLHRVTDDAEIYIFIDAQAA